MKTLLTHIRPHIDDICALWLLAGYDPECQDATFAFIPTNPKGGAVPDSPDVIAVGVGRGKFDEHKGDVGECSTTLVFNYLDGRKLIGPEDRRAVKKIVDWVLLEDTGRLSDVPYRQFTIPTILSGYFDVVNRDSHKSTQFGFMILDALLESERNLVHLEDDWSRRIEFDSRFGRAVALESSAKGIDTYGYSHGFDLVLYINTAHTIHNIRAKASSDIDLSEAFEAAKKRDPKAGWYLHHSKKMLICGGDIAPGVVPSTFSLNDLMKLVQ